MFALALSTTSFTSSLGGGTVSLDFWKVFWFRFRFRMNLFFRIFRTHVFDMSFFKLFVKLYTTIALVYLAFWGSTMVKDDYMRNKLELITIISGNSIIFDTGNINSCVVISSTKAVILGNFFKLYLFNNVHTRSIRMFLVLLNNFDKPIKSGKCANRFYNYRYFCLKYRNIDFALSGMPYKCTKYSQLRYRMFCYLFNAWNFKKVLSSFLCSFALCFKFCVRVTHIIISTYMVCIVTVIFFCSMNFSSGMIVCQNINMININTVSQPQHHIVLQHHTVCTSHVHKTNINVSSVSQYHTVCTLHSTVSQYRTVSTTVSDIINVHVNVNGHSTATNIKLSLYFNKYFFAAPSFEDDNTSTTILFSFSRFLLSFLSLSPVPITIMLVIMTSQELLWIFLRSTTTMAMMI